MWYLQRANDFTTAYGSYREFMDAVRLLGEVPYLAWFEGGSKTACIEELWLEYPSATADQIREMAAQYTIQVNNKFVRNVKYQLQKKGEVPSPKVMQPKKLRDRQARTRVVDRLAEKKPVRTAVKNAIEDLTVDDIQTVAEIAAKIGGLDKLSLAIDAIKLIRGE